MGPQHAYGLASRLEQVADHPFTLNQGTLYPALVRLEQKGWIKGTWQNDRKQPRARSTTDHAGGYPGARGQTAAGAGSSGLVDKLLLNEG